MLAPAAGNPTIRDELLAGAELNGKTYKNHLDGYNQLDMLEGKGKSRSPRVLLLRRSALGALRVGDFKFQFFRQPGGWPGPKVTTDMPGMVNLRQDPFERTPSINSENLNNMGGGYMNDFYAREFWRFVQVQEVVGKLAATAIDYPPMQDPASFNLIRREREDRRGDQEQARQLSVLRFSGGGACLVFIFVFGISHRGTDTMTFRQLVNLVASLLHASNT